MSIDAIALQPSKRRTWLWLQIIGGILAFAILFGHLPLKESWETIREAALLPLFMAGVSILIVYLWTWAGHVWLVRVLNKPQPPLWLFRAVLLSQVVGLFAPGKIGDLSIAWFLRKRGLAYGEGLAVGLFYKTIALSVAVWLGTSAIFKPEGWPEILLFILTLPAGLALVLKTSAKWIIPTLPRLAPHSRLAEAMHTFSRAWFVLSEFKAVAPSLLLALGKALNMTLVLWLILQALGHPIPFFTTLGLASLTQLAALIPISPSGLGVRELSGAIVFSKLGGVPWAMAGSMMIVSTVMQYVAAVMCYGIGISGSSNLPENSE